LAVLAGFMWPAWGTTEVLLVGGDLLLQHYPWQVLFRESLGAGEFPVWNPYTFGGVPAFANPLMAYAYPPHWALLWAPAIPALNWLLGLHVLLAGALAAWCASRLGASKDGQFLSGVAYALGSAMTARLWAGHLAFLEGITWLPLATGLAIQIRRKRAVDALALVVALMVLAGQPEIVIFSLWWLPLWAVLPALEHGRAQAGRAFLRVGLGLGLGLGLSAVQIVPTAALYTVSHRAAGSAWEWTTAASLPPWHLLSAVAPELFGGGRNYWLAENWQWHDRLFYLGLVPLAAAARATGRWRWICLGAAGIAVALALGRYAPWYAWVQAVVPGYQTFRIPPKHLTLAALAVALAAGLGIQRLQGRRVALAAVAGAALLGAASLTSAGWAPPLALVLGGTERLADPLVVAALPEQTARTLQVTSLVLLLLALTALLPGGWAPRAQLVLATVEVGLVLGPYRTAPVDPGQILAGAEPLRGHARVAVIGGAGPVLGNHGVILHVTQPAGYLNLFSNAYANLATGTNQSVAFALADADVPMLSLLGYGATFEPRTGQLSLHDPAPPQAWVARCVWPGTALQVREPDFPRGACIARASATEREAPVPPGAARVVAEGAGWLIVEAEGPGWLVTTQPWYPGWSAWIDDRSAPVEAVDGALVGVLLPPGQRTVALRYWPAGFEIGAWISFSVAALLIASRLMDRRASSGRANPRRSR
jgi:hypothetical protein